MRDNGFEKAITTAAIWMLSGAKFFKLSLA